MDLMYPTPAVPCFIMLTTSRNWTLQQDFQDAVKNVYVYMYFYYLTLPVSKLNACVWV